MKAAFLGVALLGASAALASPLNVADFPISARVLSYESDSSAGPIFTHNLSTGVVTSVGMSYTSYDREEVQISQTIYTTTILRGCRHCKDLVLGDIYHARFGQWRRWQTIQYLQFPTKGTDWKLVTLKIIGQRLAK